MTILVIDDSKMILSIVGDALTAEGYKVIEANDGKEGLLKLFRNHVDLIITDLNMPNIDGMELLKKIRQSPLHNTTPVIMMTTESQKELVVRGISLGVKAWILKPFKNAEFIETVKKVMGK